MIDCAKDCDNFGSRMCAYPKFKFQTTCINFKSKTIMSETKKTKRVKEKVLVVDFLTSLAMAVPVDDTVKHVQITIVRERDSGDLKCYFDVVDPSRVKLANEVQDE